MGFLAGNMNASALTFYAILFGLQLLASSFAAWLFTQPTQIHLSCGTSAGAAPSGGFGFFWCGVLAGGGIVSLAWGVRLGRITLWDGDAIVAPAVPQPGSASSRH